MSNKVMLVDESETRATWLKQALDEAGYDVVSLVKGMDDLHQLVLDLQPDVVIIQSLSAKRDTLESLGCRNSQYPRPVVMLTEHNDPALMQAAQRAGISPYAVAGLSPAGVQSIINVAINQFQQHEELRHQLVDAETRLANQRVLEQAKCMIWSAKA